MPKYFAEFGRRAPASASHNPFTFAFNGLGRNYWDVMNDDPAMMARFMKAMVNTNARGQPAGTYPFSRLVDIAAQQPDRTLLVDVGGGRGQAIKAILARNPEIPAARCVLQDREDVIMSLRAEGTPEMETMVIDFHKEQPVKGEHKPLHLWRESS